MSQRKRPETKLTLGEALAGYQPAQRMAPEPDPAEAPHVPMNVHRLGSRRLRGLPNWTGRAAYHTESGEPFVRATTFDGFDQLVAWLTTGPRITALIGLHATWNGGLPDPLSADELAKFQSIDEELRRAAG